MSNPNIQYDFFNGRQSLELIRTREIDGHKIKVHINRDSYDNQSSAKAYVWTDSGWAIVVDRPITAVRAIKAHAYAKPDTRQYETAEVEFNLDADDLQAAALAVVS